MQDEIAGLLKGRRGHFLLESGHHGDLWLELDPLFVRPARLDLEFCWTERRAGEYRIPDALRDGLRGKAVAIVDDVINAGSATRAALRELRACGARTVALGALLTLGTAAEALAEEEGLGLERLATLPNTVWAPSECPMCAAGEPLERLG